MLSMIKLHTSKEETLLEGVTVTYSNNNHTDAEEYEGLFF